MEVPGVMIAAPASGSGKTTIVCGLMSALKKRGKNIRACKCGPDYIDPMFHREVLGVESENLDLFFLDGAQLRRLYAAHCRGADFAVTEGVMGFYDGMALDSWKASSYDVSKTLGLPVILVVPCKGTALSICALIQGMLEFQKDHRIEGLILNRVSEMLYPRLKEMIEQELGNRGYDLPVIGFVPESDVFRLESRHLGLVTPKEVEHLKEQIDQAGELLAQTIDLKLLEEIASRGIVPFAEEEPLQLPGDGRRLRIAVARDTAFCFYYKENLELLKRMGAELEFFSPMEDPCLPQDVDGLLLGGGYPELYCRQLSENSSMRNSIRSQIEQGLPCLAECGGFMYLHEALRDSNQKAWPMAGVLHGEAGPTGKLTRFGYVNIELNENERETFPSRQLYLKPGERIKGHEFHYWDSTNCGDDCIAGKPDGKRSWTCIHITRNLFAGYPHLYYPSLPQFARRFLEKCCRWKEEEQQ